MSLRDQLQKAGLASKKDAKKAANAARMERRKSLQEERQGVTGQEDEVSLRIKEELKERKDRDKQLNQQIELERREQEKIYQAREIILSHDLKDRFANLVYRFAIDGLHIRSIHVTMLQLRKLAEGDMGIASLDRNLSGDFYLLTATDCRKVEALHPGLIVCLHDTLPEGELLDYTLIEEEYYVAMFDEEMQRRLRHHSSPHQTSVRQAFRQDRNTQRF